VLKDPIFMEHRPSEYHPESPFRLQVLYEMLKDPDVAGTFVEVPPRKATREDLERVHEGRYIDLVASTAGRPRVALDPDTQTSPQSYDAAVLAAGGCLELVDRMFSGQIHNGFAMVRPPGHHAEAGRARGFCLFNNVAVAARYAQEQHGISRVMIVDWDLHHGNGSQWTFYEDPTVLYFSSHQYPYYPGSGSYQEVGRGAGEGFTVNVPLSPGHGDSEYAGIYRRIAAGVGRLFRPQLLVISAGFDICDGDPLGGMEVTTGGFGLLTRILLDLADETCDGKALVALEGGYHLEGLRAGGKAVLQELAGKPLSRLEPSQVEPRGKQRVDAIVRRLAEVHSARWKEALE
jgi:acetoin utilization deacetylase AcuC-like enzyme